NRHIDPLADGPPRFWSSRRHLALRDSTEMKLPNAGGSGRRLKYRSRIVKGPALQGHCRRPARAKMKVIGSRRLARAGRLVPCFAAWYTFSGECRGRRREALPRPSLTLSYLVRRAGLLRITYPPVLRGLIDSFGRTPFRPFSVIQSASISPDHRRLPIGMKRLGRRN